MEEDRSGCFFSEHSVDVRWLAVWLLS